MEILEGREWPEQIGGLYMYISSYITILDYIRGKTSRCFRLPQLRGSLRQITRFLARSNLAFKMLSVLQLEAVEILACSAACCMFGSEAHRAGRASSEAPNMADESETLPAFEEAARTSQLLIWLTLKGIRRGFRKGALKEALKGALKGVNLTMELRTLHQRRRGEADRRPVT